MKKILLLLLFFNIFTNLFSREIIVPSDQIFIDLEKSLILSNADLKNINAEIEGFATSIVLDDIYNFETEISLIELGKGYKVINMVTQKTFTLFFTELPLISITTDFKIVDEPDVLGNFKIVEPNQSVFSSLIGIQLRGASSQALAKKPFEIKFWANEDGSETNDISLLGMHAEDGWNLQALFNEPLRINSKTSFELWRLIHKPYYISKESEAVSGIEMKYVELFLNGEYRGVYCVGEKVKRKLLKLKKENGKIRGELYKGDQWSNNTLLEGAPLYNNENLVWGGYEYKYPNEILDWSNLHTFINFVVTETDENFYKEYRSKFSQENAIDYFIFLNLLRATDNRGKNIYVAKYAEGEPYFYVPWDLDGTFGTIWTGGREDVTNDILSNGMYDRLLKDCSVDGFAAKLKIRWQELRQSYLTYDNILSLLSENYSKLKRNGIYEREELTWPSYKHNADDIDYINNWLKKRLIFLDEKFVSYCKVIPDDPIVIVPENPGGNTPDDPVVIVPENPGGNTPDDPIVIVPENPGSNTPDDPIVIVPENPGGNTPGVPIVVVPPISAGSDDDKVPIVINIKSALSIFPNPTNDVFNIKFNNEINSTNKISYHIYIYDASAKLLFEKYSETVDYQFSINGLSSGVYYVKMIDSTGKVYSKRVIKN